MFNYLFPIFCFGLVITWIVFLGLRAAAEEVKAADSKRGARAPSEQPVTFDRSRNGHETPLPARRINE